MTIGRRHHPVSGLMMLVDADAVEAALAGIDQLLDIFAIKRRPALGVVERIWEIYPIRFRTGSRPRNRGSGRASGEKQRTSSLTFLNEGRHCRGGLLRRLDVRKVAGALDDR